MLNLFRKDRKIVFKYKIEKGPKVFETMLRGKKFTMYNDTVIGMGRRGKELFRSTIEEPVYIRSKERTNAV